MSLPSFELARSVPESLKYCHSLTNLHLSGNALFGQMPPNLCTWLPYVFNLDLSDNDLSNTIPAEIGNYQFLNKLVLRNNRLSSSTLFELGTSGGGAEEELFSILEEEKGTEKRGWQFLKNLIVS